MCQVLLERFTYPDIRANCLYRDSKYSLSLLACQVFQPRPVTYHACIGVYKWSFPEGCPRRVSMGKGCGGAWRHV